MFWQIASFPKCEHHVFLSHCAEDREKLVLPVYDQLSTNGVMPWLDQEDYYYGRSSRAALRDGILRSRHIVFFITDSMLKVSRGWCVMELAYAELLELSFQRGGGQFLNSILPLFFLKQSNRRLPRTVWQFARDRGRFCSAVAQLDQVSWANDQITEFLRREQKLADETGELARQDFRFKRSMQKIPGLLERVTKFHPRRLTMEV